MKKGFWTKDWFAGVIITLIFLIAGRGEFLQGLERSAYDFGVRASTAEPGDKVAVIAIDDESINNLGRWPWPRDLHAHIIELLTQAQAKVIGNTVFFLEPQLDPGLAHIAELGAFLANSRLYQEVPSEVELLQALVDELPAGNKAAIQTREFLADSALAKSLQDEVDILAAQIGEAEEALNTDRKLAEQLAMAGNVVLAMPFVIGEPLGNPDQELPEYVTRNALPNVIDRVDALVNGLLPLPTVAAIPPIEELGTTALAVGHLNANVDVDGGIRSEPLVLRYFDSYYPSLSLLLAAKSLNLKNKDIEIRLGEGVRLGGLQIATDEALQMHTFFYGEMDGIPAFSVDSFYDVISGKIPPEKYRGKVVLIGATATGVGSPQVTPVSPAMAPVLTLAHSVSSILNEDFFVVPTWGNWAEIGAFLFIALYLIALLPRLKAAAGASVTALLFITLLVTHFVLMTNQGLWLQLMVPASLLLAGHLLLTTKRYLVTERGKLASDADSAETNRMLGLAFQGQGQLDMAFDKFRKCPLDDSVMDLLYNLALDYERKRQFNKAGSVYQYMADFNPKFRDLESRMSRSKVMEDTVMLGSAGGGAQATMILSGDGVQKPMLGRYQVEKELGKGAMGIVYLGKDPKINRVVAIKTMALSQEFEADELDEVKERFFREAETAGRLNHPNIVTIFDAGEEHDLAYIAMEFLKGGDLAPYTKADKLLPVATVIDLVAQSADALDYAHSQNVVHRDIKPANLMYDAETGAMKITDFGIARITDSSKTKTGMVLGTPSYMSPEQLAGTRVGGHSDLFSMGVMLFQMLTGQLPFTGDSMATLMYKIANDAHPDVLGLRPDLPPCLKAIIDKALKKDLEKRYQRGAEMARDLRACASRVGTGSGGGTGSGATAKTDEEAQPRGEDGRFVSRG